MSILTAENLCKEFADQIILNEVTFQLSNGERVGLVGANGSGKSTLMKILAGDLAQNRGDFRVASHATIGYLPQSFEPLGILTVSEWLQEAQREILDMQLQLANLSEAMAVATGDALERIMDTYGKLAIRFEHRDGYDLSHQVEAILQGLDIAHVHRDRPLASLSGGEQVLFGLAGVLIQSPDLLLLDEPTNHLDAAALLWLERYLATYPGTVIVISHDRSFLNGVVNRILEVDEHDHQVRNYTGNYDAYLVQKRLERQQWEARYAAEQEQIRDLKRRIQEADRHVGHHRPAKDNNKMAYNRHGSKVEQTVGRNIQAAIVQLNRIHSDPVPTPPEPMRFIANFEVGTSQREIVVSVSDLSAVLEHGRILYRDVRFTLGYHQRMVITGTNGAGKTTLLDMIAGLRTPEAGRVFIPARTVIGYLKQDIVCSEPTATVLDTFHQGLAGTLDEHIAQLLSYQLFQYEELRLPFGSLSPGQHRKLMIAKLMASGANLLLLDEPTNHISFSILEEFERALDHFPGAIIAVSHDRRFIERFHDSVWTLENRTLIPPAVRSLSEADNERMRAEIQTLASYGDNP